VGAGTVADIVGYCRAAVGSVSAANRDPARGAAAVVALEARILIAVGLRARHAIRQPGRRAPSRLEAIQGGGCREAADSSSVVVAGDHSGGTARAAVDAAVGVDGHRTHPAEAASLQDLLRSSSAGRLGGRDRVAGRCHYCHTRYTPAP
jgi:hypothetical protein